MNRFRERLLWVAFATTAVSVVALLIAANYAPTVQTDHWKFNETYYPVVTGFLGSLLSIGILSLIVELFLRESYAEGLRRFLGLKTAIVKSGVEDIGAEPDFNASDVIAAGSVIDAVIRDPQRWVQRHFEAVLAAAKQRAVEVTLLFPDPDAPHFDVVASSLGYSSDDLRANWALALKWIQQRWSATTVTATSKISVATVLLPLYEVIRVDDRAVVSLGRSIDHPQGEEQLALSFKTQTYPVDWLKRQVDEAEQSGEVWAA